VRPRPDLIAARDVGSRAVAAAARPEPGVITPGQPGEPKLGNFDQIPCRFNET
jgi:hypothetical protein